MEIFRCGGGIRYYPPSGDLYFDVLTRLGESARFENIEAEIKEIEGARIRVATPAALYRLKKGTVRVQDHLDAAAWADMRVEKFRSIEEMNNARVPEFRRPDFEQFLRHCARYWAIAPKRHPRGVFKFRTIEEAQKARANLSLRK